MVISPSGLHYYVWIGSSHALIYYHEMTWPVVACIGQPKCQTSFTFFLFGKQYCTCNLDISSLSFIQCISLQEADLEFVSSLASILRTIERAIQIHEDFSGVISPAELLVCHFTGIKVTHKYLVCNLKSDN